MNHQVKKMTLAAIFLALGLILPFFTGQIPQIGKMLLPMHLPVLLCGFICGWKYGAFIGFILPFLRFACFGMPMIYPTGISMAFELATYGFLSGYVFNQFKNQHLKTIFLSLIIAMIGGRIVWALAQILLLNLNHEMFTLKMFLAGAFFQAIPGILLQFLFIPLIVGVYYANK